MFNNSLSSLWNIKIVYFGAKFGGMTPNLRQTIRKVKGQKWKKCDVTNTLDHQTNSLHFEMQHLDWLLIFRDMHLNFPHIKNSQKIDGVEKTKHKIPQKDQMLGEKSPCLTLMDMWGKLFDL